MKYCDSSLWDNGEGCPATKDWDAHVCNRYEGHGGDHHCKWNCQRRWTSADEEAEIRGTADAAYERAKEAFRPLSNTENGKSGANAGEE